MLLDLPRMRKPNKRMRKPNNSAGRKREYNRDEEAIHNLPGMIKKTGSIEGGALQPAQNTDREGLDRYYGKRTLYLRCDCFCNGSQPNDQGQEGMRAARLHSPCETLAAVVAGITNANQHNSVRNNAQTRVRARCLRLQTTLKTHQRTHDTQSVVHTPLCLV